MKEKLHRECCAISSRDMVLDRAYVLGEDISPLKEAAFVRKSVGRSVGPLVRHSVGPLVDPSVGRSVHWSVRPLQAT